MVVHLVAEAAAAEAEAGRSYCQDPVYIPPRYATITNLLPSDDEAAAYQFAVGMEVWATQVAPESTDVEMREFCGAAIIFVPSSDKAAAYTVEVPRPVLARVAPPSVDRYELLEWAPNIILWQVAAQVIEAQFAAPDPLTPVHVIPKSVDRRRAPPYCIATIGLPLEAIAAPRRSRAVSPCLHVAPESIEDQLPPTVEFKATATSIEPSALPSMSFHRCVPAPCCSVHVTPESVEV